MNKIRIVIYTCSIIIALLGCLSLIICDSSCTPIVYFWKSEISQDEIHDVKKNSEGEFCIPNLQFWENYEVESNLQKEVEEKKSITFNFILKSIAQNFLLFIGSILQHFLSAWIWCCVNDPLIAWFVFIAAIVSYLRTFSKRERNSKEEDFKIINSDFITPSTEEILKSSDAYQQIRLLSTYLKKCERVFSENINELTSRFDEIAEISNNDIQKQLEILENKIFKNENMLDKLENDLRIETECRNILIQTIIHAITLQETDSIGGL
ncbi:uncharacterized protein LOC111628453 [Centruroides sculpturatus]|uniref:uncharacterized protein LOC111628453 n=1 Tax=Centruroides sculpturatus TaxID=218467 RepID=UPI000C6D39A1|nr:uncharacterized protein LOC111628453 [Centruroides sculpturatus]